MERRRKRWVARMRMSEGKKHSEHRFIPCRVEADWVREGGQEEYWTRVLMSALRLTEADRGLVTITISQWLK